MSDHLREAWRDRIEAAYDRGPVHEYLDSWRQFRQHPMLKDRLPEGPGWKYHDLNDLVSRVGHRFKHSPVLVPGIKRGPMKMCFMNAFQGALKDRELLYCEGFAQGTIMPVMHAWLTDRATKTRAYEVTWDEGHDYWGIAFKTSWVVQRAARTGYYGVFGEMLDPEWLKDGLPREALA